VSVPPARAEAARAAMLELFPEGFEEIDLADGLELVAYTDAGGEERLWHAFGAAAATAVPEDWRDRWRDFHKPVVVDGIWIGPPWEQKPADRATVVIDPGRAFGTGGHPTTRLTVRLLAALDRRGSLLDVGCGSGVLTIAAARLGFGPLTAVDIDPQAVDATRRNARTNDVAVKAVVADALAVTLPPANVAVANVTFEVAVAAAARLDVERFVSSGYLVPDGPPPLQGFVHLERLTEDGWAADAYARDAK
jgi:ribosomal protein L11 methyltransferase